MVGVWFWYYVFGILVLLTVLCSVGHFQPWSWGGIWITCSADSISFYVGITIFVSVYDIFNQLLVKKNWMTAIPYFLGWSTANPWSAAWRDANLCCRMKMTIHRGKVKWGEKHHYSDFDVHTTRPWKVWFECSICLRTWTIMKNQLLSSLEWLASNHYY